MMEIVDLLSERDIALDVLTKTKRSALTRIAFGLTRRTGMMERAILSGFLARERIGSTAFGDGIAIPHAFLDDLLFSVASLTRLITPIDFVAPDNRQVDLLLALLWPRRDIQQFLPSLANVCRLLRNRRSREALRQARSPAEAFAVLCCEPSQFRTDVRVPISSGAATTLQEC